MRKRAMIAGTVFGLLAMPLGLFAGLQFSPLLGNILLFPTLIVSALTNTPLGMMSGGVKILTAALSCVVWALVFGALARLWRRSA